jgi:hypothetical protein
MKTTTNSAEKPENNDEQQKRHDEYKKRYIANKINFPEMTIDELADTLSIDIKHDWENKLITFFCFLSAYTHDSQFNVSFNAPSSSGKTYISTAIAKYFPEDDKITLVRASPTALYYQHGVVDEKRNAIIVPLFRKIILFLEIPGPDIQRNIRSLMSHDSWELVSLLTNKDKKGANRASKVIFVGFPSIILCSAGLRLDEQEATRVVLLSPEESDEKIRDSVHFTAMRNSGNAAYMKKLEENPFRVSLKERILAIRTEHVQDIYIPSINEIEIRFHKTLGKLKSRHNRDIDHFCKLIKAIALLNIWHRRRQNGSYAASESDIDQAFRLWAMVAESQDQNTPPALMRFYKKILLPAWFEKAQDYKHSQDEGTGNVGISRQELCSYYLRQEGQILRDDYLRKQMLPQLEASGIIVQAKPSEGDQRSMHIFPQWFPDGPNNIGPTARSDNPDTFVDPFDH